MEVVAARASAVAVEVHADRPAGGAPRARAGLVVERREVGFLDGGRHGAPVRHPDAVEVADTCYWEPRPVALQRGTALGQWYDARSAAWIDIQRHRAPEDHGRGRRGRRDAVPPQQRLTVLLDDGHSVVLDFGDVGRPGERATAASVSRSGEAIHTTERLALRRLEVMTRAVWGGGPYPALTQHAIKGIAHTVPTARACLLGGAVRHASRRLRNRDSASGARGGVWSWPRREGRSARG